jgi:hypothetical protein
MKKNTVLELTDETAIILAENKEINSFINEHQLDYSQFGIIAPSLKEDLKYLLKKESVFENEFILYHLENPEYKNIFTDFGFITKERKSYLYEELVIPFVVSGYNEKDLAAALEQMDEHLVAIDRSTTHTFYYVDRYHQELIEGFANAYRVVATFYQNGFEFKGKDPT